MKRLTLLALLLFAYPAFGHSVLLSWGASPDAVANPTLTYNVYRAAGACSASTTGFTMIGSTAAGILTFTDPNVSTGASYCYYMTAALAGIAGAPAEESSPSTTLTMVILPAPPTSLKGVEN